MAIEAGKTDAFIAAAQQKLKTAPSDPTALVTLGYLLPARGDTNAAEQAWQELGAGKTQP
jgi:cytochrome c-type biogenesis protein CcmH/NrfG